MYYQISGLILDSSHALVFFWLGGVISLALTLLFLAVAICSKSMFTVTEEEELKPGEFQELKDNILDE